MKQLLKYSLLFTVCLLCLTCKKKTSLSVTVFNYALNEPVADATVVLVERKENGGLLSSNNSCTEIASATTDENGKCHFDKEKLKTNKKYNYFLAITSAYDLPQGYPCNGKTSGFLIQGVTQEKVLDASGFEGFIRLQENNLFNPTQAGDSLFIRITSAEYTVPGQPYPFGGGGVLLGGGHYVGFPYPSVIITDPEKTQGGKKVVKVRKRKMGVVTTSVDTVKVYPNQTTTVVVDW